MGTGCDGKSPRRAPRSRRILAAWLAASAAFAASCGGRGGTRGPEEIEGLPHRTLEVTGHIGVELGDSNCVFSAVRGAVLTTDGRIVVSDIGTFSLRSFTSSGDFLHRGGRRGEGPGEYTMPACLAPCPGGGVVVSDLGSSKLIFYDSTLALHHEVPGIVEGVPGDLVVLPDSAIVGSVREFDRSAGSAGFSVRKWEPGASESTTLYRTSMKQVDRSNPREMFRTTQVVFAAAPDGRVFVSVPSTEEYLIECYSPDGTPLRIIERAFEPAERTEEDILMEREMMASIFESRGVPGMMDEWEPERLCTAITDLDVSGGLLWARRGTEVCPFYDVYDLEGNPLFTCSAPELPFYSLVAVVPGDSLFLAYEADPVEYPMVHILEYSE